MQKQLLNINKYIKNGYIVTLTYNSEIYHCQVLQISTNFLLARNTCDYHFINYTVFMNKYIEKIQYGKLEAFRNRIFWSINKNNSELNWIDLSTYHTLFQSMMDNHNLISLYGATKHKSSFYLGRIDHYDNDHLYIREITPFGKFSKRRSRNEIGKITKISFGDKYDAVLFKYANETENEYIR